MRGRLALVGAVLLLGGACSPPPAVSFAPLGPGRSLRARDYPAVHRRWTRYRHVRHSFETALDVHATLVSDELRAAYFAKVVALRRLSPSQQAELGERLRSEGERWVEFVVQAVTSSWAWNDFTSTRSLWTITLADDAGHVLGRPEVASWPEKADALRDFFPPVTPFTRTWRVRFPRVLEDGTALLGPNTHRLTLRIAGPLGSAELRWEVHPGGNPTGE